MINFYVCTTQQCQQTHVFGLSIPAFLCPSIRPFAVTDLVTTISREQFEQSRWQLIAPTHDLIRFWRLNVKVTAGRWNVKGIHVKNCQKSTSAIGFIVLTTCGLSVSKKGDEPPTYAVVGAGQPYLFGVPASHGVLLERNTVEHYIFTTS